MVVLTFPVHVDQLILPLDPKGTKGIDANGLPLMAYNSPVGAPQPSAVPNPNDAGKSTPVPAGPTPSYFGVEKPPQ